MVLKRKIETVNGTSIILLALFAIFVTTEIPKGLIFALCLYVLGLYHVHVLYYIPSSAEITHRGLRDLKRAIQTDNNNNNKKKKQKKKKNIVNK